MSKPRSCCRADRSSSELPASTTISVMYSMALSLGKIKCICEVLTHDLAALEVCRDHPIARPSCLDDDRDVILWNIKVLTTHRAGIVSLSLPAVDARSVELVIAWEGPRVSFAPTGYVVETNGTLRHVGVHEAMFFARCLLSAAWRTCTGSGTTLTHQELLTTKK